MILTIDTSSDEVVVGLLDNNLQTERQVRKNLPARQSDDLLGLITEHLQNEKISFSQLKMIAVNPGPGSFTGIRVGLTTANFLAFSLNIPITDSDGEKMKAKTKKIQFIKPVLPVYDRLPHITFPKSGL